MIKSMHTFMRTFVPYISRTAKAGSNVINDVKCREIYETLSASFKLEVQRRNSAAATLASYITVTKDEQKRTANIMMQRPPVNSLNLELLQQLTAAIKNLEEENFKGLVLSSSSPTVFSAGLDITEMYNPEKDRLISFWKSLQQMWKTLYLTPLVTVAAVNGHAPAGGCLLAMSCDHAIMVKTRSSIGLNESKLGIIAPKWFRDIFINTIGASRADHALKLGMLFTAEEAKNLGIVHRLVDSPSEVIEKAEEDLDKFLQIPNQAFQETKISMRKYLVNDLIAYEDQEVKNIVEFLFLDEVQKKLKLYLDSLKQKKP